jgi:hypothetical protein
VEKNSHQNRTDDKYRRRGGEVWKLLLFCVTLLLLLSLLLLSSLSHNLCTIVPVCARA